jgi:hypothetical protein
VITLCYPFGGYVRRLKLVTGVDISTRPVRRFGKDGNVVNRSSLTAAAAPKRSTFCWSLAMISGYLVGGSIG